MTGPNCCRTANPSSTTGTAKIPIARTPRTNRHLRVRRTVRPLAPRVVIKSQCPRSADRNTHPLAAPGRVRGEPVRWLLAAGPGPSML
jgi:hypothetical protein